MRNTVSCILSVILLFSFCIVCFASPQGTESKSYFDEIIDITNKVEQHIENKFKHNKKIVDKVAEIKSAIFTAPYYRKLSDSYMAHLKNIMLLVEYLLSESSDTDTINTYLCRYYNEI